jgi:hypothetical protein
MVRIGDEVAAGAVIATVGRSGLATAPHLHYEVLVRGRNTNPLHTPLAALLEGKAPAASASPPPEDSALREPAIPDVPTLPDTEPPVSGGDTIALAPLEVDIAPVARTPVVAGWPPSMLPATPAAARDTARKS